MYLINTTTNRMEALPSKYFGELGFTERKHLQEWLAYEPNEAVEKPSEPPFCGIIRHRKHQNE